MLIIGIAVSFVAAVYLSVKATVERSPSTPASVTQETHGDQSPAIQGVTGNVTITNNQPDNGETK